MRSGEMNRQIDVRRGGSTGDRPRRVEAAKRLLAAFLSVDLALSGLPTRAIAAVSDTEASAVVAATTDEGLLAYLDERNATQTVPDESVTDISDSSFKDEGGRGLGDGWYAVSGNRGFNSRLTVSGDAKLVLCDGVVASFEKGIHCKPGARLTIYAQSTGKGMGRLVAKGPEGCAGVGCDRGDDGCGRVAVRGGRVEATGGKYAAGLGGGGNGGCDVEVSGGVVVARGGKYGAGVGTGDECPDGGSVRVFGGSVDAEGGSDAAGIGGGNESVCEVLVGGGEVTAHGGKYGAGIGTGDEAGVGGRVSVRGGVVQAWGGEYAAGVGGGDEAACDVEVHGGALGAVGGTYGAGIGTGDESGKAGSIVVTDGTLSALSGRKGAGIGGGNETEGGKIAISGGNVTATAADGVEWAQKAQTAFFLAIVVGGIILSVACTPFVLSGIAIFGEVFIASASTSMAALFVGGCVGIATMGTWAATGAGIGPGDESTDCLVSVTGGTVIASQLGEPDTALVIGSECSPVHLGDDMMTVNDFGHEFHRRPYQDERYAFISKVCRWMKIMPEKESPLPGLDERCGTWGDCAWALSEAGELSVAPKDGVSGRLADARRAGGPSFPWLMQADQIVSATFSEGVELPADCHGMFDGCSSLASIDVSGWDVSGVRDTHAMFRGCSSLTSLDVSDWDVSGVKNMSSMFDGCSSLESLDVSRWNVSSATDMYAMFAGCSSLFSLDLSGWDVSNAKDMRCMFDSCSSLSRIFVGERFDASRAFPKATSEDGKWLSGRDGGRYTVEEIAASRAHVADVYFCRSDAIPAGVCGGCFWELSEGGALCVRPVDGKAGRLADSDRSGRFSFPWLFPWLKYAGEITSVSFAEGVELPADCHGMFDGCSSLASIDVSFWDVSQVTDMSYLFSGCTSLVSIDVSDWNVSDVTDMRGMFDGCSSLVSLVLSSWDMSHVTRASRMFAGCSSLSRISVGERFDASCAFPKATSEDGKWLSAKDGGRYTVDEIADSRAHVADTYLSQSERATEGVWGQCAWELSADGVLSVRPVDGKAGRLADADRSGGLTFPWLESAGKIVSVAFAPGVGLPADCSGMFEGCSSLDALDVSEWDVSKVTYMSRMFAGCSSLSSLNVSDWDVSGIIGMHSMFRGCSSLAELDVSDWDVSKVMDMCGIFRGCASLTCLDVSGWKVSNVTDMQFMFFGCSSLSSLDVSGWDVSKAQYLFQMFFDCSSLVSLELSRWNVSNATNMAGMLDGLDSLSQISVGELFDASRAFPKATSSDGKWLSAANGGRYTLENIAATRAHVADIYLCRPEGVTLGLWGECLWELSEDGALYVHPVSGDTGRLADADRSGGPAFPWLWHARDIVSVDFAPGVALPADCSGIFRDCESLTELDLSEWDMSGVTNLWGAFSGCSSLKSLDLSTWDVSKVSNTSRMFYCCLSLTSINVSGWDVSTVRDMSDMFDCCSSLVSLDLSSWNVSNATNMAGMLDGLDSLSQISVGELFDASRAFPKAASSDGKWLSTKDGERYTVEEIAASRAHVADTYLCRPEGTSAGLWGECFWELSEAGALCVRPVDGKAGRLAGSDRSGGLAFPWLYRASEIVSVDFAPGVALPADCSDMFRDCTSLTDLDVSGWDVSGVTDMARMFWGCSSLTSLDVSCWDVSGVTDAHEMFGGCKSLSSLDVSRWNVSRFVDASGMFLSCLSLAELDVSGWDVSGMSDMHSMFRGCASLASLDVSAWNVSGARHLRLIFDGCSSLASLDLSGWDVTDALSMDSMFSGCSSLSRISVGERFDASKAFPTAPKEGGKWWSKTDRTWYSVEEIASLRAHVADTYFATRRVAVTVSVRDEAGMTLTKCARAFDLDSDGSCLSVSELAMLVRRACVVARVAYDEAWLREAVGERVCLSDVEDALELSFGSPDDSVSREFVVVLQDVEG